MDEYNISLTKEEIEYILEAFDIFPTINSYGGNAVKIEDSINAKLSSALEREKVQDFNFGSENPKNYTLEDEVYPDGEDD